MKYLKVFLSFSEDTKMLNDAEMGRLFRAMMQYADAPQDGSFELRGNERFVWPTAKRAIDNQREAYDHQCAVNKQTATNRYESSRNVTNRDKNKIKKNLKEITSKEVTKKAAFAAPSLEEVTAYCDERRNKVDPERFLSFYEAKGWMLGKNRMKDWKAAVRTWELRETEPKRVTGSRTSYAQTRISDEEFDALAEPI